MSHAQCLTCVCASYSRSRRCVRGDAYSSTRPSISVERRTCAVGHLKFSSARVLAKCGKAETLNFLIIHDLKGLNLLTLNGVLQDKKHFRYYVT